MAGLLEYLLAQARGGVPMGFPAVPPGVMPERGGGPGLPANIAFQGGGGFDPIAPEAPAAPAYNPAIHLMTARDARSAKQRASLQGEEIPFGALGYDFMGGGPSANSQAGTYGDLTNPGAAAPAGQPSVPAMAAPQGSAIASAAADLPPSTNDPEAREPVVFADGVPVPRPRPNNLGNAEAPTDVSAAAVQPGAPMSLAPAAAGPAAAAPDAGGGMGGLLGKIFNPANAPLLLALGSGLSGAPSFGTGMRRASAAAVAPAAMMNKDRQTQQSQAQTYQSLVARGVPPQEAMAAVRNPEILKATVAKYFETKPAQVVNGRLVREKPDGTVEVLGDYSDAKEDKDTPKLTAGYQWVDPKDKSKGQTWIVGGEADPKVKAQSARLANPPSYEWIDPEDHSKGQRVIEGSAGTKLPTDVAGKLALMQEVQKDLPDARRILMEGRGKAGTGVSGVAASYTNIGDTGRAQRTVRTAIEAALRVMTGAAAPETEVTRYLGMYMPSPFDSRETATQKLDQLEGFITRADKLVNQGRSAPKPAAPGGTTKSGVAWSVEP